jgi:endoglucanase
MQRFLFMLLVCFLSDSLWASPVGASRKTFAIAAALSRGINLSVYAAPREGDWGLRMDDRWIDVLAKAGFRSIRISVRFSNHASLDASAQLDEAFAKRIDQVIDAFLVRDMMVVLNVAFYKQLDGRPPEEGELLVASDVVQQRFVNIWRQLAKRHANRSDRLLFELYNAPQGAAVNWNALLAKTVAAIRSHSKQRVIVVAPVLNAATALPELVLPADRYLMVTIHSREPRQFTYQGSPWVEGSEKWLGTPCCDATQKAQLAHNLELAKAWSDAHHYPVWLGLFGAASTAPMDSRARYLRAVREATQALGMSWAHIDFAANFNLRDPPLDSGIYNVVKRTWHAPLRDALLGP